MEKLKWEKHVATHRLEKDMPVIEAKIQELKNLLTNIDKPEAKFVLNQDEFTGMHLIAHGDKSVFQVESLDGYQTVRRFSDKALRSGTNYKAAQVRNDLYKVGFDKLSVTKFTNCTNLGLEDNQVQKVVL